MIKHCIRSIIGAAALLWVFPICVQAAYTSTQVNIRTAPIIDESTYITTLNTNTEVDILENFDENWAIIDYKGQLVYISSNYLSNEKVATALYSASWVKLNGVFRYNGYKWTWYSDTVLSASQLKIPGFHYDENNYICDENNYICLASGSHAKGSILDTPLGKQGKVYDYCPTAGVIDIYVHW